MVNIAIEEFLARKYLNRQKCFIVFYRFSKWCRPFSQNGMECNKNYGKKATVLRPYYETKFKAFFVSYCTLTDYLLLCVHNATFRTNTEECVFNRYYEIVKRINVSV